MVATRCGPIRTAAMYRRNSVRLGSRSSCRRRTLYCPTLVCIKEIEREIERIDIIVVRYRDSDLLSINQQDRYRYRDLRDLPINRVINRESHSCSLYDHRSLGSPHGTPTDPTLQSDTTNQPINGTQVLTSVLGVDSRLARVLHGGSKVHLDSSW